MKIDKIEKVAIVGLGMMGASLAAALKNKFFKGSIIGYSRNENTCKDAIEKKIVDDASINLRAVVENADLIVMCLPIDLIINKTNEIFDHLKDGAIVTDIGSTKKNIVSLLEKKFKNTNKFFVGSHPICGSEKSGFKFYNEKLFENKVTVICSSLESPKNILNTIKNFWEMIDSKTIFLNASLHDKKLALTSHLPHILSSLLIDVFEKNKNKFKEDDIYNFCGTGFNDVSRLASGSSDIWKDIILTNSEEIIYQLEILEKSVNQLRHIIANGNSDEIYSWLNETAQLREKIISKNRL